MSTTDLLEQSENALQRHRDFWEACQRNLPADARFPHPGMLSAWIDHFSAAPPWRGRLQLLTAKKAGLAIGMLPLFAYGPRWAGILSQAGPWQPWRSLQCDALHVQESAEALVNGLRKMPFNALQLGPLREGSQAWAALSAQLQAAGFHRLVLHKSPLAYTQLPESWDIFVKEQLHKSVYDNARYYTRRMERDPTNTVREWTNPTGPEAERLFVDLNTIESRSWLVDGGNRRFTTPGQRAYWKKLSESCEQYGACLQVWTIHAGDKPIAFSMSLGTKGYRHLVANNYDEEYAKWTTGAILYLKMFQRFLEDGVREVDFGTGSLHYKEKWGAAYTDWKTTYLVFKPGALGWLKARAVKAGMTLKDRYQRWRNQAGRGG